jgi:inorganic triphosphatase YgiF
VSLKQWYRGDIQWAVMVEGKEGLRQWEESVYLFQSEDREAAFQKALEIGRRDRHLHCHEEDRRWVERRLARIAVLEELGVNPTEIEVYLGTRRATERLPFEHEFNPEGTVPMSVF